MSYEFADRLIELRRAQGLSQESLAKELGISRQAVSKWERAESAPDIGNLTALADLYGVTLDELVRGSESASAGEPVADATQGHEDGMAKEPEADAVPECDEEALAEAANGGTNESAASANAGASAAQPASASEPSAPSASASVPPVTPVPPAPPVPGTAQSPAPQPPKKKRTWLKVTLIVLLCLLLCGSIAGCGLGCSIAAHTATGLADQLSASYDQLSNRGNGSVAADDVHDLEIGWLAGSVTVKVVPDADAGGMVVLEETSRGKAPAESRQMRWALIDSKLVISSSYSLGFWGCSVGVQGTDLTLQLPESTARALGTVRLASASGYHELGAISCENLSIDMASGQLKGAGIRARHLDLSMASGNANLEGSFEQRINVNMASGQATVASKDACPQRTDIDLASGNLSLLLPPDASFTAQVERMSGAFTCGFPESHALQDGTWVHGAGSNAINATMLSGNLAVQPLAS